MQPPNMLSKPGTSLSRLRKKAISLFRFITLRRSTGRHAIYPIISEKPVASSLCVLNDTGQQCALSPLGDPLQNVLRSFQLFSWAALVGSGKNVTKATGEKKERKKQQLGCTLSLFDTSVPQQWYCISSRFTRVVAECIQAMSYTFTKRDKDMH